MSSDGMWGRPPTDHLKEARDMAYVNATTAIVHALIDIAGSLRMIAEKMGQ